MDIFLYNLHIHVWVKHFKGPAVNHVPSENRELFPVCIMFEILNILVMAQPLEIFWDLYFLNAS